MKKYFNYFLNILIVLAICSLFFIVYIKTNKKDVGIDTYKTALNFYTEADYQNAYYNFVRVPKNSKYYYISLFRQGMCAEKLGDTTTQAQKYAEFTKNNNSKLVIEALFKSGIAYFYNKDDATAKKMFKKAIKYDSPDNISDYIVASNYFLGEIEQENNPKNAVKYYINYLSHISDGKYSCRAAVGVQNVLDKNTKMELSQDEYYYIANALYECEKFEDSEKFLSNVSDEKYWHLKAKNAIKLGQKNLALERLQRGLQYHYEYLSDEDLSDALANYLLVFPADKTSALLELEETLKDTQNPVKAEIYYELKKYDKTYEQDLRGKFAANALFELFFDAYNKRNYNLAKVYAAAYLNRFPKMQGASKVLYYWAKILHNTHKYNEAKQLYTRVLVDYPDTFWAFRAYAQLNDNKPKATKWAELGFARIDVQERIPQFPYSEVKLSTNDTNLINDLIKIGDYDLIEKLDFDNLALRSWTNYMSGNYALSVVQARDYLQKMEKKPSFKDNLYVLAYPIKYKEQINKNAKLYNVNAFLIESLIREESYFNTKIASPVGALGLMQIMPATASFIAGEQVSKNDLLNPDFNIALGVKYYNYVKKLLNNNNIYAVLSYNGGPGAVQGWVKKYETKDFDEFIEKVPYDETQNYVQKVFRTYWNYLNVYKSEKI